MDTERYIYISLFRQKIVSKYTEEDTNERTHKSHINHCTTWWRTRRNYTVSQKKNVTHLNLWHLWGHTLQCIRLSG